MSATEPVEPENIAAPSAPRDLLSVEDLAISRALLAAIVDSTDDAVVSKSLDGIIQSWNAGATRMFGYQPEEIIGRHITTIIPPELRDEERQIIERIRAGQRVDHFETVRVTKDGRKVAISITVSPIRNAQGRIVGASKIARDISDRRESEERLRESRSRIAAEAAALARLSEASTRLWRRESLEKGLEEVLRTVKALTGATKGNVQLVNPDGKYLVIVAQEGFDAAFLAAFDQVPVDDKRAACGRALSSARTVVIEDVAQDDAYEAFQDIARHSGYRAVISVPLFAAEGSKLGAISVHFPHPHRPTDAEMRRLQLYCRQASDFIQRLRLEQTLRQSQEALQDADRRKNEFLALLAHELRNPLAPIRYALAAITRPELTGEQKVRAEAIIERQVAHMSRLLDDLLDISRITRGTLELKRSRVDLADVIATAVEAAQPFLDAKRHALFLSLPPHPVVVDADPVRLAQVFSNLLINAAKYTCDEGRVELAVTNGQPDVTVTVRDNGIGISPEMMPKLFNLFTQAHTTLDRSDTGLGVGLALVRGLVNLHGGSVSARSEGQGRGSEFVVRLPIGEVEAPAASNGEPARPGLARALRVLVVDDNRDAADSCATLLELEGHRTATAYTGTGGLALGDAFHPQAVLLDIGLPDVNGYEIARRIRATDWGRHIYLVAITGWGQEADRERAFAAGFDHHLTKPVTPQVIETLLRELAAA
ncbi:MAG TPA: PAS domain S-box protein [Steroidobacteraceae bacterium]|nr:PAS domain S-box protein [Steroidobacteraceae bacterium]